MSGLVRARVAGWTFVLGGVLVGISACEASADGEQAEEEPSESAANPPVIVEPMEVTVSAAQRQDITIATADLLPNARVEIDGRSWSLAEAGPVVRAGQTLRVPLGGALVVGTHELVVAQLDGNEPLRSDPLTIRVEAAELRPLLGTLEPGVVGGGDRLVDAGPGERLLGVVDDAAQTVELRRGDWSLPGAVHALPGLGGPAGPVGGWVDLTEAELEQADGTQRWLITSWLADGGERVRARITAIDGDDPLGQLGEPGAVLELWSLAEPEQRALLGPHEVAINHGVALLDRMVVVAVEARRDAELASPGDRVLVSRWLSAEGLPADIQLLRGPIGRDLDLPERARLWLDLGPSEPTLSVRLALAFPWLLELAGNGLPVLREDPGEAGDVPGAITWMASADGALGSRHVFALELDGEVARVRALRIDRWGPASFVEIAAVDVVELPALPTAAPSLAMVAGSPTVLIPFGVGTPAWGMRSTGETVLLDSLDQLDCDALALTRPDVDGEGDSQTVACLADRELRVGSLALAD